jgi:FkbM family methyltransferase
MRVSIRANAGRRAAKPLSLQLSYQGGRFTFWVTNPSEVEVAKEMFVEEQYAIPELEAPRLIVDLGSNIGASIAFFRARFPDARIIGLEPDPSTFPRLQRFADQAPRVEVHPWAIASESGRLSFHQQPDSWASSLASARDENLPTVEAISLDDLRRRLQIERIDLLKLDVEGAEWQLFEHPASFDACNVLVGELHFQGHDHALERVHEALAAFDVTITARTATHVNFIARRRSAPPARVAT